MRQESSTQTATPTANYTLKEIIKKNIKLTPMMEQYVEVKKKLPETLVFFRMGDFYELFFEDAKLAAKILNIAQTHRGKLDDNGVAVPIPMAGIPHHAAKIYVDRITREGHKVAICEQIEDPKEAKGIVKRAVTQIVSPGMPYDLDHIEGSESHYIATASYGEKGFSLSAIDFTTGEFWATQLQTEEAFIDALRVLAPKEFIHYFGQWKSFSKVEDFLSKTNILLSKIHEDYFKFQNSKSFLAKIFPNFSRDKVLKNHEELKPSLGALAFYITSQQEFENIVHLKPFQMKNQTGLMQVSFSTLSGLEIIPRQLKDKKHTLLGFLDHTRTSMGSRKLFEFLTKPLYDKNEIQNRQELIELYKTEDSLRELIREKFLAVKDIDRILAKITTQKINSNDLLCLKEAILIYDEIQSSHKEQKFKLWDKFQISPKALKSLKTLSELIEKTINDEQGASIDKGNLIKKGYSRKRDKLSNLSQNVEDELLKLEESYRSETKILKLRVKKNNVAGFFIEVPKSQSDKMPKKFVRKQTLTNTERFLTDELKAVENETILAKDKLSKVEREIFNEVVENVTNELISIRLLSENIAFLDVITNFTDIAIKEGFTKPLIVDGKRCELESAWHPLVKRFNGNEFINHSIELHEDKFFALITGPNMAGKTTVMREIAIIQLMAQMGSFVPAQNAKLSLCDFLFSRLGANDNITQGLSTFMVEMTETAEILRHATEHSLILLDEVGRGTSTYDGLSIAWSLTEHIASNIQAMTLFATHYHELIEVVDQLPGAVNMTVATKVERGVVQFLYHLIEAPASESYGIYVAKLAGLPAKLLSRANSLLKKLETQKSKATSDNEMQMDLFDIPSNPQVETELETFKEAEHDNQLRRQISEIELNKITPLEALNKIHEIQSRLQ
ncbi:MAG: DNA mismatch repair protein MutS [Bacteriovoracaceae bacterium]